MLFEAGFPPWVLHEEQFEKNTFPEMHKATTWGKIQLCN